MRGGEGRGNKSSNYRKTNDKQNPSPLPLMRGGSFPQESIFPALAAKLDKFALHVFIYIQKAIPKGDNQIHAGINTLESDRHEVIACIPRASIGNRVVMLRPLQLLHAF